MDFFKSPVFIAISTLLSLVFAAYISYIEDLLGAQNIALAATFTVLVCILAMAIYAYYANSKIEESFINKIKILENFIKANGMGDIINEEALSIIERNSEDIWVITNDLANDIGISNDHNIDAKIIDVVKENLHNNKRYVYFLPNTKLINGRINEYLNIHRNLFSDGQVKVCLIPYEEFHFVSEIVLYDVRNKNKKTTAVQWFPNKELNYYLMLDDHNRSHLVGILDIMLDKYGTKNIDAIRVG